MTVYFIQAADGTVKIGRANNVAVRLSNLQTAHAKELTLIRCLDGGAVEEWECQHAFRDARIRGEWFEYREEMLTFQPAGRSKLALLREYRERRKSAVSRNDDTLVSFVRDCVRRHPLKQGEIARRMGYSPSSLSRKLAQYPDDGTRFTLDDLEKYIEVTGDTAPILYLLNKYLPDEAALLAQIEALQSQLKGRRK